jgi:Predicted membrane protein (DUF2207)
METPAGQELAPPRALRPAQLGVILVGRVTLAHIGATVVDLAGRGHVRIEPVEDDGPDWELTALERAPDGLLAYERTLLDGLFDGPQDIRLARVTARMTPLLDQVRSQVVRDAVGAGLLGHGLVRRLLTRVHLSRPGQGPVKRTRAGEELLEEIKAFRRELRAAAGAGGADALGGCAPYAMIFGLSAAIPADDSAQRQPPDGTDPRAQTADFAARWHKAWEAAAPPVFWISWYSQPSGPGHTAAPGHAHGGHGGGYQDSGFHGGHGGFTGGHGGGFGGHV